MITYEEMVLFWLKKNKSRRNHPLKNAVLSVQRESDRSVSLEAHFNEKINIKAKVGNECISRRNLLTPTSQYASKCMCFETGFHTSTVPCSGK
jgi:hypothetical protein